MSDLRVTRADVMTYVEWLTFMPGWSFSAMPHGYVGAGDAVIGVRIMRQQPDTDHPPYYDGDALDWYRECVIDLSGVENIDDVGYLILTTCIEWLNDRETNEHEAREFFRVNVDKDDTATGPAAWHATFHPHRVSGHVRWHSRVQRDPRMAR